MGSKSSIVVLLLSLLSIACWAGCCLYPHGWHLKTSLIWNFDIGLYKVVTTKSIGGHALKAVGQATFGLGKMVDSLTLGESTIEEFRNMFCVVSVVPMMKQACKPWEELMFGSWILIGVTAFHALLVLVGCGTYVAYWNGSPTAKMRRTSLGLLLAAQALQAIGLAVYICLSFNLARWLVEYQLATDSMTISYMTICAGCLWLVSFFPLIVMTCIGGIHPSEENQDYEGWMAQENAAGPGYPNASGAGCQAQGQPAPGPRY